MKPVLLAAILAVLGVGGALGAVPGHGRPGDASLGRSAGAVPVLHLDPGAVRTLLGAPAVERHEGRGALWTYRSSSCALLIFFRDEDGLKVSGAEAGARRRGDPEPDLSACLKSVVAEKPADP